MPIPFMIHIKAHISTLYKRFLLIDKLCNVQSSSVIRICIETRAFLQKTPWEGVVVLQKSRTLPKWNFLVFCLRHNTHCVIFCFHTYSDDKAEMLHAGKVFGAARDNINPRGVDAAVAENVGKLGYILVRLIKGFSK